jgi:hypothetical protein
LSPSPTQIHRLHQMFPGWHKPPKRMSLVQIVISPLAMQRDTRMNGCTAQASSVLAVFINKTFRCKTQISVSLFLPPPVFTGYLLIRSGGIIIHSFWQYFEDCLPSLRVNVNKKVIYNLCNTCRQDIRFCSYFHRLFSRNAQEGFHFCQNSFLLKDYPLFECARL